MVNFGLLAAEIVSLVWGTPANFNGFHLLAALQHGTPLVASTKVCGIEQRAPPTFSRMAITLGIGPHSSLFFIFVFFWCRCLHRLNVLTVMRLTTSKHWRKQDPIQIQEFLHGSPLAPSASITYNLLVLLTVARGRLHTGVNSLSTF